MDFHESDANNEKMERSIIQAPDVGHNYHIVDVFAENKYQGNQLAVIHVNGSLSDETMLNIAKEMNYSETTFIESFDTENHVYQVRIFTKTREVPFAGHPTLGTAYVIQQTIEKQKIDSLTLDLKAGRIPVRFTYQNKEPNILWMKQLNPRFGKTHEKKLFAEFLRLDFDDIDPNFPVQEVSTGLPFFIVPLKTRKALAKSKLKLEPYLEFVKNSDTKAVLVFCPEPRNNDNQLACRMYAPSYGIEEDPATGSANGCLAGYLAKYRYFGSPSVDIRVEQGYEMGRPSLLYLKSNDLEDSIEIYVGGKCVKIAKGELIGN
jgi:trans-2,3-dihydro-3-hydroxyanthranilate isomerase